MTLTLNDVNNARELHSIPKGNKVLLKTNEYNCGRANHCSMDFTMILCDSNTFNIDSHVLCV